MNKFRKLRKYRNFAILFAVIFCLMVGGGIFLWSLDWHSGEYCYKGILTFNTLESYYTFIGDSKTNVLDMFSPHTEELNPKSLPIIITYTAHGDKSFPYPYSVKTELLGNNKAIAIGMWLVSIVPFTLMAVNLGLCTETGETDASKLR